MAVMLSVRKLGVCLSRHLHHRQSSSQTVVNECRSETCLSLQVAHKVGHFSSIMKDVDSIVCKKKKTVKTDFQ